LTGERRNKETETEGDWEEKSKEEHRGYRDREKETRENRGGKKERGKRETETEKRERVNETKSRNKVERGTLLGGEEPSTDVAAPHYIATMFGRRIIRIPSRRHRYHKPPETTTTLLHSR